jgi:hypothetical protein
MLINTSQDKLVWTSQIKTWSSWFQDKLNTKRLVTSAGSHYSSMSNGVHVIMRRRRVDGKLDESVDTRMSHSIIQYWS